MHKHDFKYFKEHYQESVATMFSAVSDLYATFWNDFFHFALFEHDEESWEVAFERTHRRYMEDLRVEEAEKVIVLACGRGGFANLIAAHTRGDVLGIDLSEVQLARARRFERANLRFKHHDIMRVDTLGETFDAAVCLDAACYLPDKALAIKKIARILKPGARLLVVDWCRQEGLSRLQEEMVLHPFMRYWAIPSLETVKAYEKYFQHSGFELLRLADLNEKVRKDWDFGYECALKAVKELSEEQHLPGLIWTGVKLGPRGIRLIKEQFPAALYIKAGFDTGFLRYAYFLGEKK